MKKWFQLAVFLLIIWLLILLVRWVLNDLFTFRFESSTLNDWMLGIIGVFIFFGVPIILAEIYEKWKFLDRIYWEDKRRSELTEYERNKNGGEIPRGLFNEEKGN